MRYRRRIQRNGASIIIPPGMDGPPWTPHNDPAFLRWMGQEGYSCIDEIPAEADYRTEEACQVCGEAGTLELHHWAPKEWFGKEEAERWPKGDLCRACHATWHREAERAAARITVRILRGRGLWKLAQRIEDALS